MKSSNFYPGSEARLESEFLVYDVCNNATDSIGLERP